VEFFLEDNFTPKQVAAALKVSESSVKRWCDRGEIRSDRTIGGHRRIPLGLLLEFLESTNRRLVDPFAIGLEQLDGRISKPKPNMVDSPGLLGEFERALVSGTEVDCRRIMCHWFTTRGGISSLADELIRPAFQAIGSAWKTGAVDIYEERHACEIIQRVVNELRRLIPEPSGMAPLAMGATPSGDQYHLGTLLTDLVFRESGWRTANLGSNIPFTSLLSAARKHMPKVFWLSISHVEEEAAFLDKYAEFAKRLPKGVILIAGGQALNDQLRPKMVFSSNCDGMRQLSTFAKSLRESTLSKVSQN